MSKSLRQRLRALALRSMAAGRLHSMSLVSAAVLAIAAAIMLTSGTFTVEDRRTAGASLPATEAPASGTPTQVAAAPAATPTWTPPRPRRSEVIYLVIDEAQEAAVIDALQSIVWDDHLYEGRNRNLPVAHFLIAGTPENEELAIQRINAYLEITQQQNVDVRVVDLRPDRRPAANAATP